MKIGGLRGKAILLIVPLIIIVVLVFGFVSVKSSQAALLRIATRLLAFKAEQIRDFSFSQWEVLVELGYSEDENYQRAAQAAIQSYASTLIRNKSERIFAIDSKNEVAISTSDIDIRDKEMEDLINAEKKDGWFEANINGIPVVGEKYDFPPFDWQVYVTDERQRFYSDFRRIAVQYTYLLIGAILFSVISILVFISFITKPVERLQRTMAGIAGSLDLSRRVPIESTDEVGELAQQFNLMVTTLDVSFQELEQTAFREAQARKETIIREQEALTVLGAASEFRDEETAAHVLRVGELSGLLARVSGQDEDFQEGIVNAAPLHDVGKIGVSDTILFKPGRLTDEEFDLIKEHTTMGWNILKNAQSRYLMLGAEITLTHHEKWDGSGYPKGLGGLDIPVSGRIVCLADVYDALRSDRPYKKGQPHEEAVSIIAEGRSNHFDPALVDCFIAHEREIASIYSRYEVKKIDSN